jgi:hypothetical protein
MNHGAFKWFFSSMELRRTLVAILLMGGCLRALAQSSSFGNWMIYFGNASINKKLTLFLDAQDRNFNAFGDLEQVMLRTALLYNVNENMSIGQGYGYIIGQPYIAGEKNETYENRIFQQLILKQRFGRLYLTHRYRLEERFLQSGYTTRLRYFLSVNLPLNHSAMERKTIYLAGYNEVFLNVDTPIFDRNRLYGGIGFMLSPQLRLEAGAMWQMYETRQRGQFNFTIHHNFSLKKKEKEAS